MPSPSVLHYVGYDTDRGGIVSVVRALAQEGRFECILGVNAGFKQSREPRLHTLDLPHIEGEQMGPRAFWRARTVAQAAEKWLGDGPDRVFHGHSRAGLMVALWLARLGNPRVVVSVHCYGRQRWFYRWSARRLRGKLYWLSPAMKAYYGLQLSADWSNCIPGCVSSARSRSDDPRRKANGILKIGGIGTIERWKGWDLVLRAIAALPAMSRKNIRFVHIGSEGDSDDSRSYAAELKERTALLGLEGSVEWRGQQPSSQGFLSEIDCLVIASNNEPFSASMLEALASGVPVLAADSGGARDIIAPPRNGWLFKSGDEMDLSRNLELLLHTDALNSVEIELADIRRFSAAHVAGEWTEVYLKLLRSK